MYDYNKLSKLVAGLGKKPAGLAAEIKPGGPAVEIDKASFNYGKIKALDELSLQVPAGISFGLLGPNGAGKTTLIRLLVGLFRPRSGTVRVLGQKPSRKIS